MFTNKFCMNCVAILGIVLLVLSSRIDAKTKTCHLKDVVNASRGLVSISVVLTVLSLLYLFTYSCQQSGPGTLFGREGQDKLNIVMGFVLVLGFVLLVLGSIIRSNSVHTDCSVKVESDMVITVGVLMVVLGLGFFGKGFMKK